MKDIKKFYTYAILLVFVILCSIFFGPKIFNANTEKSGQGASVENTDYGLFLAGQHALYVNDFNNASLMVNAIKTENKYVNQIKNMADFFSGKMPQNAALLKDSKDLVSGLIYDAFLIQQDDWKNVYNRHSKDKTIFAAPLRIFAGIKQGKIKETNKFIDSLSVNDSWKSFVRGQIAVLRDDIDGAAKEFANVHPDFMNINDYLYLMSFYQKNGMVEDMEILRNDFLAKPGGMYVSNYPEIPDWSNYAGYKNNLVFSLVQNISHTQLMIYTDLSLMFLRFAQLISNETNMDMINYYLGQYYFYNDGDYKNCFESVSKSSPLYLFSQLNMAEKNGDFNAIKKIAYKNPLFVPATQIVIRESVKNGYKRDALAMVNRALKQKKLSDAGKIHFLTQRAHIYLMFNDASRAQKDLNAIKDINDKITGDVASLQIRTWILQKQNLDDAYHYAMLLVKNNTSDVYAWDLLGQIVAQNEGVDNALELIESVAASGASMSSLYEHLGDLYIQKGDKDKALRAYNQALDLSDDCFVVVPILQKKIRKLK